VLGAALVLVPAEEFSVKGGTQVFFQLEVGDCKMPLTILVLSIANAFALLGSTVGYVRMSLGPSFWLANQLRANKEPLEIDELKLRALCKWLRVVFLITHNIAALIFIRFISSS
jgi:hypothetical protein